MASGYDKIEFWKAYCRFFTTHDLGQPGLIRLGQNVSQTLDKTSRIPGEPIHVLCLGIGVAGFEFPLLSALHRASKSQVVVTGLDKSSPTLNVSARLCKNLTRTFADSTEFAEFVDQHWSIPHQNNRFVASDLDGRAGVHSNNRPWDGDAPSQWADHIRDTNLVPSEGFDIVLAAFCFHHVHWWRATLCKALSILRPGGILMFSQVDGDVSHLDWNQPEDWLTNERIHNPDSSIVRELMKKFWRHEKLQQQLLRRQQAGAVRPWDQLDLLDRLPLERLISPDETAYFCRSDMSSVDIKAIMETRGLSPFRRAKEILDPSDTTDNYEKWVEKCIAEYKGPNPSPSVNRIRWHAYANASDTGAMMRNSIFQKFSTSSDKRLSTRLGPSPDYALWEFELTEASSVAHKSFHSSKLDNESFVEFLKELLISGSLSIFTPFGVMGQRLIRQEKFTQSSLCFSNPLVSPASMQELMLYMCLRQSHLKDYSNSHTLLKEILPKFNVPVVFSYERLESGAASESEITVNHHRYRSFLEVRFKISLPKDYRERLMVNTDVKEALEIVSEGLRMAENTLPSFVLPIVEIDKAKVDRFRSLTERIAELFRRDFGLSGALDALNATRSSVPVLCDALSPRAWKEMVESLYWLSLIPDWKKTVIFPATYSNPDGEGVCADDSLILFYSENLPDVVLRHEFRKVSLMLDQLNMRRLASLGEAAGLIDFNKAMSHELAKQTNVLFSRRLLPMSAMVEIDGYERTSVDNRKWSSPVGSIHYKGEGAGNHLPEMAGWLVCPTPRLFDALKNYLFLWAGATNMLEALADCPIHEFSGFLNLAIEIARSGSVSRNFQEAVTSLEDLKNADKDFERALAGLPCIEPLSKPTIGLLWIDSEEPNARLESVLIVCLRALVAGFHNAIQHTPKNANVCIQYSIESKPDGILVTIRNPIQHRDGQTISITQDGTWGVIRNCLRLLDKDTTYPQCGPEDEYWVTKLLLPNPAKFKGEDSVSWLC